MPCSIVRESRHHQVAPWTAEAVVYDGVIGPSFLEAFGEAAALECLHYVLLLPPELVCAERVRSRVGHSFTDLAATGRRYREFADAEIDPRHVVTVTGAPTDIASSIFEEVTAGTLRVVTATPARPS